MTLMQNYLKMLLRMKKTLTLTILPGLPISKKFYFEGLLQIRICSEIVNLVLNNKFSSGQPTVFNTTPKKLA